MRFEVICISSLHLLHVHLVQLDEVVLIDPIDEVMRKVGTGSRCSTFVKAEDLRLVFRRKDLLHVPAHVFDLIDEARHHVVRVISFERFNCIFSA